MQLPLMKMMVVVVMVATISHSPVELCGSGVAVEWQRQ